MLGCMIHHHGSRMHAIMHMTVLSHAQFIIHACMHACMYHACNHQQWPSYGKFEPGSKVTWGHTAMLAHGPVMKCTQLAV